MIFSETELAGAFVIEPQRHEDSRGFFARTFCRVEFRQAGIDAHIAQCNISFNRRAGTLRGMHFQKAPHGEAKLIRCTRGRIYDVIVDIRPDSPTFRHSIGQELTDSNRLMLYVPPGFAHGFLTLEDDTEVFYQMSEFYEPSFAAGFRWNDPAFGIEWPAGVDVINDRDRTYPDFEYS